MYILVLLIVDSNWQLVIIQQAVGTVVFLCIDWFSTFSALTLLVGWQEGHPAYKNWVVGCCRGYLSGVSCRLAYVPLPLTVSCFSKIQIGFTFLVPAHPGNPDKGPLKGCVCEWFCFPVLLSFQLQLTWPPRFLAECCKRQLNQGSFFAVF